MRIVIVGGGFAGLKTALELASNPDLKITLISDRDHFLYYPALYSTATGHSHLESVVPLSKIIGDHSVKLVIDKIEGYDPTRKTLTGAAGTHYTYDIVVFALGVVTNYFGIPGLDTYSYSIKSKSEVDRFKHHLHDELASDRHMDKHYVVVGAGPTGVELSAALVSYLHRIADAHHIKHGKIRVQLVEAAPRVLPRMSERASNRVLHRLKQLGVDVKTGRKVEAEDSDSIEIDGKDVPTKTVVWTSGVSNNPFFAHHDHFFKLAPNGKVTVDQYMQAGDSTYVIGDNAATPYAGLAQTALHDAHFVAADIRATYGGLTRHAYRPIKPPVVVPVGENWAIFEWYGIIITGIFGAWIRRAADLVGYHDLLPIGQALGTWRAQNIIDDNCEICTKSRKKA
jgi:NADH:ubiquinone reductase (H+-translocating)